VGDSPTTGDIVLREGDNIEITMSEESGKTVLTISANTTSPTGGSLLTQGLVLENDDDVFQAIVESFGTPITTINGISPDTSGNFSISGEDCMAMDPIEGGLSFSNTCSSDPCCEDGQMDQAYSVLDELNQKCARLSEFYSNVTSNIEDMKNKLLELEASLSIIRYTGD
jgi:hypothetical protein